MSLFPIFHVYCIILSDMPRVSGAMKHGPGVAHESREDGPAGGRGIQGVLFCPPHGSVSRLLRGCISQSRNNYSLFIQTT